MNKTSRFATNLITVHSLDDVPDFATEAEEADFWGTHTLSDELLEQASHIEDPLLPPPGTAFGLSLGFSAEVAQRLRTLAKKKRLDYVAMTRAFVMERLTEEEKREGIIGDSKAS